MELENEMKLETRFFNPKALGENAEKDLETFLDSVAYEGKVVDFTMKEVCHLIFDDEKALDGGIVAITYCNKEPANMVLITDAKEEKATIELVITRKKLQGKGIGFIALRNCTQKLKENGCKTVASYVSDSNLHSIAIHKKNGFVFIGDITYVKLLSNTKEVKKEGNSNERFSI